MATAEQVSSFKKGDRIMWYSGGIWDGNVCVLESGWQEVVFIGKRASQGSPSVAVEYLPGKEIDVYYHEVKTLDTDTLFDRWNS